MFGLTQSARLVIAHIVNFVEPKCEKDRNIIVELLPKTEAAECMAIPAWIACKEVSGALTSALPMQHYS